MVRPSLAHELVAAEGLVAELELIEDQYAENDDDAALRMKPKVQRLLELWRVFAALDDPDEDEQRMRILLPDTGRLGLALFIDASICREVYEHALEDAKRFGFEIAEAIYSRNVGNALTELGQFPSALEHLENAARMYLEIAEIEGELGLVKSDLATCLCQLGRFPDAEIKLREAIAMLEADGDEVLVAMAQTNLGNVLYELGRSSEAESAYRSALDTQERLGLRKEAGSTLGGLASLLSELGQDAKAFELASESLKRAREFEDQSEANVRKLVIAGIYRDLEQPELAAEIAREVIGAAKELGDQDTAFYGLIELADSQYELNENEHACQSLERAERIARLLPHPTGIASALSLRARILVDREQPDAALELLAEARELFDRAEDRHGLAGVEFHTAIAALQAGDIAPARIAARRALELYEAIDSRNASMVIEWLAATGSEDERD